MWFTELCLGSNDIYGFHFLCAVVRFLSIPPLFKAAMLDQTAAIPEHVPYEDKAPMAVTSWLVVVVGFCIKEALSGQAQTPSST